MLDLHKLHQFAVLVRTGSYGRAAEELHLSQSALTRNIQALEKQYGVTLIERERGRKGLQLTDAGQRILGRTQELLRRAAEVERELGQGERDAAERIAVGMGPMLASVLLPGMLGSLISVAGRPSAVSVVTESPAEMTRLLLHGDLDFYVGQEPAGGVSPRVRQELFGTASARLWVRPAHPLAGREHVDLDDIAGYLVAAGEAWNRSIVPTLDDERLYDLLTARLQIDNYGLLVDIVSESDALMVSTFGDRTGRLVQLPVDVPTQPAPVYFFSLKGLDLSPFAARMKTELKRSYVSITG
ncbi:DNA-binding transcriptional LysR family regulator [Actinocorallia herbida]|uniref:DNA-binding transcriptional LysR family regulator n=1 Tax=Actinocorallia herbida TaxID=58109 RepID=A0A3N1CWM5_9ACTN|nr:LysR family transcriptional regulator [Actinocorallia herbida]ROO85664.1 DNA-binding transcriptional LysR family regulator [Actinocorallia herbida]